MYKIEMKDYVTTACLQREKGFTFVSILLMITVLSITLPLQGYMIQAAEYENNYAEISAQQFFQFLRDDVIKSTSIHASEKKLYLHQNDLNVTATFELYGSLIRRQVNGQGHEVYLRDVDAVTFSSLPYGVHVTVTMLSGDKYEKSIVHYK